MVRYKDSDSGKWILKEHTKIKHEILDKYLNPWAKILSKYNKRLVIVDGFAGRGEYTDESGNKIVSGSPIILMNLNSQPIIEELVCICIEKDPDNYNNLCEVIEDRLSVVLNPEENVDPSSIQLFKSPSISDVIDHMHERTIFRQGFQKPINQTTKFFIINDKFEQIIPESIKTFLEAKDADKSKSSPAFYFIDPYGFHGIPFELIKNILKLPKTEVLLTFMSRDINRFNPLKQEENALISLFGNTDWKTEIKNKGNEGQESFLNYYRERLKKSGIKFVIAFKIGETERRQSLYYLIHASNNFRAVDLMKETMYYVNPDYTYYGPDNKKLDRNQTRLDIRTHPLKAQLLKVFSGQSITFEQIRIETIDSNIFIEKDYRNVIKDLEKEGLVEIKRVVSKKTGIKDNDIICFK